MELFIDKDKVSEEKYFDGSDLNKLIQIAKSEMQEKAVVETVIIDGEVFSPDELEDAPPAEEAEKIRVTTRKTDVIEESLEDVQVMMEKVENSFTKLTGDIGGEQIAAGLKFSTEEVELLEDALSALNWSLEMIEQVTALFPLPEVEDEFAELKTDLAEKLQKLTGEDSSLKDLSEESTRIVAEEIPYKLTQFQEIIEELAEHYSDKQGRY